MNIWDKNSERKGMKVKINFTRPERVKDCHRKKYQLDKEDGQEEQEGPHQKSLAEKTEVVTARVCLTPS